MKVLTSTIVSFLTGRLYNYTPPSVLFGELQSIITNWIHSEDWQERVNQLDEKFGFVEIK